MTGMEISPAVLIVGTLLELVCLYAVWQLLAGGWYLDEKEDDS